MCEKGKSREFLFEAQWYQEKNDIFQSDMKLVLKSWNNVIEAWMFKFFKRWMKRKHLQCIWKSKFNMLVMSHFPPWLHHTCSHNVYLPWPTDIKRVPKIVKQSYCDWKYSSGKKIQNTMVYFCKVLKKQIINLKGHFWRFCMVQWSNWFLVLCTI